MTLLSLHRVIERIWPQRKRKTKHIEKLAGGRTMGILSLAFWTMCTLLEAAASPCWFHQEPSIEQWWQLRAVSAVAERFARKRRSLGFTSQHGLSSTRKKSYTSLRPTSGNADGNSIASHVLGPMTCTSVGRGLRGHDGKFGSLSDVLNNYVPEKDEKHVCTRCLAGCSQRCWSDEVGRLGMAWDEEEGKEEGKEEDQEVDRRCWRRKARMLGGYCR